MGKHKFYEGIWHFKHVRNGKILWEKDIQNALVDEGEKNMLNTYFRSTNAPTTFYLRLCYDTISVTDSLSDVQNEPSGNGYLPLEIERSAVGFPTIELNEGDYRVTSKEVSWVASGGEIGPVNCAYLATTSNNTGKLIAFVSLAMERTVLDGDTMYAQFRVKLK